MVDGPIPLERGYNRGTVPLAHHKTNCIASKQKGTGDSGTTFKRSCRSSFAQPGRDIESLLWAHQPIPQPTHDQGWNQIFHRPSPWARDPQRPVARPSLI